MEVLSDDVELSGASPSFIGASDVADEVREDTGQFTQRHGEQRWENDAPDQMVDVPGLGDRGGAATCPRLRRGARVRIRPHRGEKRRGATRSCEQSAAGGAW